MALKIPHFSAFLNFGYHILCYKW